MASGWREARQLANKAGLVVAGFAKVEELIDARAGCRCFCTPPTRRPTGRPSSIANSRPLAGSNGGTATVIRELTGAEIELGHGPGKCGTCCASEGGATQRIIEGGGRLRRYRLGQEPGGGVAPQVNQIQDVHDRDERDHRQDTPRGARKPLS